MPLRGARVKGVQLQEIIEAIKNIEREFVFYYY